MSVTEQIQKLVSEKPAELLKNDDLWALSAFYEAAKRDGIVKVPEYSLPLIDTIGRPVRPSSSDFVRLEAR